MKEYPMRGDGSVEEVVRTILAKGGSAAADYHSLPDRSRQDVLGMLDDRGLRLLTRLIKASKKDSFKEADRRIAGIAASLRRTPVYVINEGLIEENMRVLRYVKDRTGCKILHALKAYASFATFGVMSRYLNGVCASGVNEARLGRTEFGKEVHTFGAAYGKKEIGQIVKYSDSVIFNSFHQLREYSGIARKKGLQIGLRVNPGHAEVATEMYNPCAPRSRLGIVHDEFVKGFAACSDIVDGLHFHAMCEQNSDVLGRVL